VFRCVKTHTDRGNPPQLLKYLSGKSDRQYQFWKPDPLAIPLSTIKILEQNLVS